MRIKALGPIKQHPYYLSTDDVITVDDDAGAVMVANGWAENVDTGEINPPNITGVDLDVPKASHGHAASEV